MNKARSLLGGRRWEEAGAGLTLAGLDGSSCKGQGESWAGCLTVIPDSLDLSVFLCEMGTMLPLGKANHLHAFLCFHGTTLSLFFPFIFLKCKTLRYHCRNSPRFSSLSQAFTKCHFSKTLQ